MLQYSLHGQLTQAVVPSADSKISILPTDFHVPLGWEIHRFLGQKGPLWSSCLTSCVTQASRSCIEPKNLVLTKAYLPVPHYPRLSELLVWNTPSLMLWAAHWHTKNDLSWCPSTDLNGINRASASLMLLTLLTFHPATLQGTLLQKQCPHPRHLQCVRHFICSQSNPPTHCVVILCVICSC